LGAIDYIQFPVDTPDFQFFIDDIHVVSCDSDDNDTLDLCLPCGTKDSVSINDKNLNRINFNDTNFNKINFNVFPNPILSGEQAQIQLIDIQGRVYYASEDSLEDGENTMNMPTNLSTGMYFLKIYDLKNNRFRSHKLMILN